MKEENPYKILLEAFGEDIQLRCAVEEMGELLQAICKYQRKLATGNQEEIKKAIQNLQEEIADVTINMEELSYIFGEKEVETIKKFKIERALKRAELHDFEFQIKKKGNK